MREWNVIEVLRHARHDWLNRLQLIKGYIALGNLEKVDEIMNEIIHAAEQELKLSNLTLSKFVSLLLTFNWEQHSFVLHYEVSSPRKLTNFNDEKIFQWFSNLFQIIDDYADPIVQNDLYIEMNLEDDVLCFFIEFYGIIKETEAINQFLHKQTPSFSINRVNINPEALSFEIKIHGE